jgi:hypothetical protein
MDRIECGLARECEEEEAAVDADGQRAVGALWTGRYVSWPGMISMSSPVTERVSRLREEPPQRAPVPTGMVWLFSATPLLCKTRFLSKILQTIFGQTPVRSLSCATRTRFAEHRFSDEYPRDHSNHLMEHCRWSAV